MARYDLGGQQNPSFLNEDRVDYRSIRPAEVCSIETAKSLGIFDATKYYTKPYDQGLRTFAANEVISRNTKTTALCTESPTGTSSPNCLLVYPGLVPQKDGTCGTAYKCPPNFKADPVTGTCKKPVKTIVKPRATFCDKRPTDVWVVPNSYMGNRHEFVKATKKSAPVCYKPCDKYHVRFTYNVKDSKGKIVKTETKCADKVDYAGGVYALDSDFCNSAWVKRLSMTTIPEIEKELVRHMPTYVRSSPGLENLVKSDASKIMSGILEYGYENLGPQSEGSGMNDKEAMDYKCANVEEDNPYLLKEAYDVCKRIADNPKDEEAAYIGRLKATFESLKGLPATQEEKDDMVNYYRTLKQACHYTFCDEEGSARAGRIAKPPICLKPTDIQLVPVPKNQKSPLSEALKPSKREAFPLSDDTKLEDKIEGWRSGLFDFSYYLVSIVAWFLVVWGIIMLLGIMFGFKSYSDYIDVDSDQSVIGFVLVAIGLVFLIQFLYQGGFGGSS